MEDYKKLYGEVLEKIRIEVRRQEVQEQMDPNPFEKGVLKGLKKALEIVSPKDKQNGISCRGVFSGSRSKNGPDMDSSYQRDDNLSRGFMNNGGKRENE